MANTVLRVEFEASTAGLKKGAQDAIGIVRGVNSAVGTLQGIAGSMLATPILQAAEALAQYRQQAREAGTELASKFSPDIIRGRIENRIREMQVGQQIAGEVGASLAEAERRKKEQELALTYVNAVAPKTLAEKALYPLQHPTQTLAEGAMASESLARAAFNLAPMGALGDVTRALPIPGAELLGRGIGALEGAQDTGAGVMGAFEGLFRLRRAAGLGESAAGIAGETAVLQALRAITTNTEGAR